MKKKYFSPSSLDRGHLPIIVSRRIFGSNRTGRGCISYRSGSQGADDDDDDEGESDVLIKKIKRTVREQLATRATVEQLQQLDEQLAFLKPGKDGTGGFPIAALRELADDKKGAMAAIAAQGMALRALEERLAAQPADMSVRAQCAGFIEKNKETIDKILTKRNSAALQDLPMFELELRAVANPMTPATVMPSGTDFITRYEVESGVSSAPLPVPTFWDLIPKGKTNAETYVWINKIPREGAAAFIAPGVYKPNISFTLDTDKSHAKKVAASEKMALELLQDVEGFTDWVETELRNAVLMEVNTKLTTGVLSNTVPAGIRTLSVGFQGTSLGLKVVNPNYWDAIKAGVTQLRSQPRFIGRAITVLVNPVDKANADMTKAQEQGQLFVPATIDARIVEDPNMPVGYVQIAILDAYKVKIYKPFSMAWGWENDDFTKNLVTVIGEMRLHQYMKDYDAGAFIYDTFANIIAGIKDNSEAA